MDYIIYQKDVKRPVCFSDGKFVIYSDEQEAIDNCRKNDIDVVIPYHQFLQIINSFYGNPYNIESYMEDLGITPDMSDDDIENLNY